MAFSDWSTNPANNASKPGIDWSEGMLPGNVNNSARGMMADLATWLAGPSVFPGNRPASVNSSVGRMTLKGDTGGWEVAYTILGSDDSTVGAFGALGSGATLSYLYMGLGISDPRALRLYPNSILSLGGDRPFSVDAQSGRVFLRGSAGGWEIAYTIAGQNGGLLGGFGALGNASALTFLYMGGGIGDTNALRWYPDGSLTGRSMDMALGYRTNGQQVVGARQAAIANATADVSSLQTQLNAALAALRAHGLIAS